MEEVTFFGSRDWGQEKRAPDSAPSRRFKMDATAQRVALAIPEQRRELGLSVRRLARLSGVSRDTITKLERGGYVDPALTVRVATALTVLGLYAEPQWPPLPHAIEVDGARRWVAPSVPPLPAELEAVR
jgi:DNA-binding XRE family transcriptional regulator